jgi:predicted phage terminase large subunit-like protein
MAFPATLTAVRQMSRDWPQAILKLVEDKANGPAVIATLRSEIDGLVAVEPDGGKVARAHAVSPTIESGNVYVPHPLLYGWVDGFLAECTAFPTSTNDDRVDTATQALRRLRMLDDTGDGDVF